MMSSRDSRTLHMSEESHTVYRVTDVCLDSDTNQCIVYLRGRNGQRHHLCLDAVYDIVVGAVEISELAIDRVAAELQRLYRGVALHKLGRRCTYYRGHRYLLRVVCADYATYNRVLDGIRYNYYGECFMCNSYSSVENLTLSRYGIYGSAYIVHGSEGTIRGARADEEFEYKPLVAGIDLEMLSLDYADPECPLYMGSYFSDSYRAVVYTEGYCGPLTKDDGVDYVRVSSKYEVAARLAAIVASQKPDIVTGYNIYNADMPLLYHTLGQVLARWPRMTVGAEPYYHATKRLEKNYAESSSGLVVRVPGSHFIDMYAYLDKQLPSEEKVDLRLGEVAAKYLGGDKDPFTHRDLSRIFYSGDETERHLVMRYCLRDSELTVQLYDKFNVWNHQWSVYSISAVEPQRGLTKGIVDITYGACYSICKGLGIYMDSPNNRIFRPGGGLVLDSAKGFYSNVYCVDFTSLYPSIVLTHHIDALTVARESREALEEKHGPFHQEYYYEVSADGAVAGLRGSRGDLMYFHRGGTAVMPTLLERLLRERAALKEKLKLLTKGSLEHLVTSGHEQARKECANGACGALAEQTEGNPMAYCALNDIITCTGRTILSLARSVAQESGYMVVYGDTDSLMISTNKDIQWYLDEVHKKLPPLIRFKVEYKSDRFIMGNKKHYVVKVGDTIKIAGYKAVKSSSCRAVQRLFRWLIGILLEQGPDAAALAYAQAVATYTSSEYCVDLNLFVCGFSYKGKVYAPGTYRAHVIEAMRERGLQVIPGNTLQVLTVKTLEMYLELHNELPPIQLPRSSQVKGARIYTIDEVQNHPEVVDILDIIETQCGLCLKSILECA